MTYVTVDALRDEVTAAAVDGRPGDGEQAHAGGDQTHAGDHDGVHAVVQGNQSELVKREGEEMALVVTEQLRRQPEERSDEVDRQRDTEHFGEERDEEG